MFNFRKYASKIALITEDRVITYNELQQKADEIGNNLPRRTLVFSLCNNSLATIIGYIGIFKQGSVQSLIDSELDKDLLARLIEQYKPEFLWCPSNKAAEFGAYKEIYTLFDYSLLQDKNEMPCRLYTDLALLMTTSGSTGSPKLVRQSYENLKSNTKSIIKYLNLTSSDRAITNLPMHYVYGLSVINTHLAIGGSIVVTDKTLFDREFWQLVREKKVTNFNGVPYTYEMLKRLKFFKMQLPSLRLLTQAGGKLDINLHKEFAQYAKSTGKKFFVMYGAAEATARMGYLPADMALKKLGAMGIAIPGGRFELDFTAGLRRAGVGELVYHGSNVTLGYADAREDLSLGDERLGTYSTGDLACVDSEGYYTIVGRKNRFIKMFGKRINLGEVEEILREHFNEVEIACAGIDNHLYVFAINSQVIDNANSFLVKKIELHSSAITVKQLTEIPKNSSGKVIYKNLEKYYDL